MVAPNRWRTPLIFLISGIALGLGSGASRPARLAIRRASLLLIPLALPGPIEATLVLAGTVVGCALLHHFIVLRFRWLQPLFGVRISPNPAATAARNEI
jgi:hypothetical protein